MDYDYNDPRYEDEEEETFWFDIHGQRASVTVPKTVIPPGITVASGAAGGFLLGGPLGALIGAAAGYFISKPKRASVSYYRR